MLPIAVRLSLGGAHQPTISIVGNYEMADASALRTHCIAPSDVGL